MLNPPQLMVLHIQIQASETKEGEASGRVVPLNSLVYLQTALIYCCPHVGEGPCLPSVGH